MGKLPSVTACSQFHASGTATLFCGSSLGLASLVGLAGIGVLLSPGFSFHFNRPLGCASVYPATHLYLV